MDNNDDIDKKIDEAWKSLDNDTESDEDFKKRTGIKENEDGSIESNDDNIIKDDGEVKYPDPERKEKRKKKESEKDDREKFIINKYSQGPTKLLYEAIFVGGLPFYAFCMSGQIKFIEQIVENHRILIPPQSEQSCFTKPYVFANSEEVNRLWAFAKVLTISDLFKMSKHIWQQYLYHKPYIIDFLAATTIFTYFQDRFYSLFYPFIVGDTDTGKGTVLELAELTVYRPYRASNVTEASIYRVLSWIEEGQCTMLLDEANKMSDTMIEIHKSGYKRGAHVLRVDEVGNKKVVCKFFTFGQRWFVAEKSLDIKGIDERCFYLHAIKHKPKVSLWKVLSGNNAIIYQNRLREFDLFRKLLLFYRLLHYDEPITRIKINKEAREEELVYPLLQMFYGTDSQNSMLNTMDKLLEGRSKVRLETIQAMLHGIITRVKNGQEPMTDSTEKLDIIIEYNQNNPDSFAISLETIDQMFLIDSESVWKYHKEGEESSGTMVSKRLGEITARDRTKILRDVFHGEAIRLWFHNIRFRVWKFPIEQLESLKDTYTEHKTLKIVGIEDSQIEDYKPFELNE